MKNKESSDKDHQSKLIIAKIRQEERLLRERFPILKHQDLIAIGLFFFAFCIHLICYKFAMERTFPILLLTFLIALAGSILHELEHDIIHDLYFKNNPILKNILIFISWGLRPLTINSWARKSIHLKHHKLSGTSQDLEERLITNGMPYGLKRLICAFDGFLSYTLRYSELREIKNYSPLKLTLQGLPFGFLYYMSFYFFLFSSLIKLFWIDIYMKIPHEMIQLNYYVFYLWSLPNFIRQGCLQLISSTMHYYGDVEHFMDQTQILKHPLLSPLQLFCFSFGRTHTLHHFVPKQPFYIRHLIAPKLNDFLISHGVRINDFKTVFRNNRFHQESL